MKTILWVQNENPSIPTTVLVDGIQVYNDDKQNAFDILNQRGRLLLLTPKTLDKIQKKYPNFSRQTNFNKPEEGGIYIQGSYQETDDVNRRMPYMFYDKDAKSMSEAIDSLRLLSSGLNRSCNEDELRILNKASQIKQKKKLISITIISLLFITLFILIIISAL